MATTSTTLTKHVHAPVERVWAVLTDLDNAAGTLSGITAIERVSGEGYAVGTRWRETRTMFGRPHTEEMWVAEVDAPRRTVVKARQGNVEYTTTFTLTASGDGADLVMEFAGATSEGGRLARVLMTVFGGLGLLLTRRMMAKDLDDIAAKAQAGA